MVEQAKAVKEWWRDLPRAERVARAAIGMLVLLYGGILGFDRIYQAPARLDAIEATTAKHTSDIMALQQADAEQVRTQEYLICLSEAQAGIGSKTPMECANERIRMERER